MSRTFLIPFAALFLLGAIFASCTSLPDYPPDLLIGESYFEANHKQAERALHFQLGGKKTGMKIWPLLIFTAVPGASKLGEFENAALDGYTENFYFFSLFLGGTLPVSGDHYFRIEWKPGQENIYDGPLNLEAAKFHSWKAPDLAPDEVLILHKTRFWSATSTGMDLLNLLEVAVFLGRINSERYRGEVAKIKYGSLMAYLRGKPYRPPDGKPAVEPGKK